MAQRTFRSGQALLASKFLNNSGFPGRQAHKSDRILHSTGLEDMIYSDLRKDDPDLDAVEEQCRERLGSFPALERDIFQSFYTLSVRKAPEEGLTERARQFNAPILGKVMGGDDYRAIKAVCEGEELPAYEAAAEFMEQVAGDLDQLMADACGHDCKPDIIDHLQEQHDDLCEQMHDLAEQWEETGGTPELERLLLRAANAAESKGRQVAELKKRADRAFQKNQESIETALAKATSAAAKKAREVHDILVMWGGDPSSPKKEELNQGILDRVKASPKLMEISRRLGRLLELVAKGKKNGYTYGCGEKHTIEVGNKLSRVLSSEFAYLARPETTVLFMRKYQRKALKQCRKREPVLKGCGDIIMCIDDSISTAGEDNAWGKAAAMALLRIARDGHRRFALIHFSSAGDFHTDIFLPGQSMRPRCGRQCGLWLKKDFKRPMSRSPRMGNAHYRNPSWRRSRKPSAHESLR